MLTSRSHNEEGSQVEDIEVDLDLKKPLKKEKIVLGREPLPVEISTPNVEENSSCCSKLTLSWYWTLMAMSFRKFSNGETVNASDLGRVHPQDRADYQYDIFDKLWQAELQEKGLEKASLWKVWFRFVGWGELCFLFFLTSMTAVASTGPPLIAYNILRYLEGKMELSTVQTVFMLAGLFLCPLVSGICNSTMFFRGKRASLHAYAALTTAMYRKSLRLSPVGVSSISTGKLVHMFSSDAGTSMERVVIMMMPALLSPIQFVVYLMLIFTQIGWSCFSAMGLIILILPMNIKIFTKVLSAYQGAAGATDKRVKLVNELITGIRIVKFYAWEKSFVKVIEAARELELGWIEMHAYWMSIGLQTIFIQLPGLIQLAAIMTFVLTGGLSDPATIFTAIMFFQLLQQPVSQMPNALSIVVQLHVGLGRIGNFLKSEEQMPQGNDIRTQEGPAKGSNDSAVSMQNVTVSWGKRLSAEVVELLNSRKRGLSKSEKKERDKRVQEEKATIAKDPFPPVLQSMTLNIMPGELVMVCGEVGCGKSSFLMTIANETIKTEGTMNVRGRTSFATQTSFCFSETLQKNVTFGTKFDQARYDTVIDACALRTDLKQLEGGDQIVLGERGINLSGGQKARVGLARAVYAPSQIILLDDVLSAVDSHVGDHIFEHCLKDYLVGTESRTVIFATNQLHRLQHADRILFIENGKIEGQATTLDELLEKNVKFRQMMDRGGQKQTNSQEEQVLHAAEEATGDTVTDASAAVAASTTEQKEQEGGSRLRRRTTSGDSNISSSRAASTLSEDSQGRNKSKIESGNKPILLHLEEEKQIGHVSSDTYKFYCEQAGYVFLCFAIFGVGLQLYINIGAQFWLGIWTTSVGLRNYTNVTTVEQQIYLDVDSRMIGIYAGIMFASFVSMLFGAYLFARVRVKVARNTHSDMLKRVASAPVSFFDVTPLGRILNRFSSDQKSVDFVLTIMVMWSCVAGNMLLSAFLAMTIGTGGVLAAVFVPLLIAYFYVLRYVRHFAIEMQRLEANARSPLYASFSEVLAGLVTVRAYGEQDRFQYEQMKKLNDHIQPYFMVRTALMAWLTLRINTLSSLIVGGIGCIAIFMPKGYLSAGTLGVAFTYALVVENFLRIIVFVSTELEVQMNSMERIKYYSDQVPDEAPAMIENTAPPPEWPQQGRIDIQHLTMGYRDGPDVLKDVSFTIEPQQKVAIVGRTGSGKSSLLIALFRISEPRNGTIIIDGVDVSKIGLTQLRSKLGIIPQDPVLFTGSLRYNLDPFKAYSDDRLWEVLQAVEMRDVVERLPGQLTSEIAEGGRNFSVGQRQLICMARALLLDPKILLLDEATASLDSGTDQLLQKMIRKLFKDKTVLTIAHRLDTVMDSDRVLVMDGGVVSSLDTPRNSLGAKGIFYDLVYAEGEERGQELEEMMLPVEKEQ